MANLRSAVEQSKERPLARLLTALGIRGVGGVVAESLADHFGSLDALMAAATADMESIPGIGPKLAAGVADWFSHEANRRVVEKLRAAGVRIEIEQRAVAEGSQPLAGQTWVITGVLPTLSREAASRADQDGWRQGHRFCQRQDDLPAGRRKRRQQARQGRQAGRHGCR